MFRAATKFSLRRSLHTQAPAAARHAQLNKLALVGAASTVAVSYLAWRASSPANQIALDSPPRKAVPVPKPEIVDAGDSGAQLGSPPQPSIIEQVPKVEAEAPGEVETPAEDETKGESEEGAAASGGSAAYNPETGEINWDCPCLGGMAHGPCGEQFREAFSCFVFSEDEPKGINCVTKFKAMQDCFREHPDIYGEEIADDEEEVTPSDSELFAEAKVSEFVDEIPSPPPQESSKVPTDS